jgi:hypothetical protein
MKNSLYLCIVILSLLLTGCGPSSEALTATSVSFTETAKPTITLTPTVTVTPTMTPSPTPPPASAKAMLDWRALNLSDDYEAVSLSSLGIDKDAPALAFSDGSEYFIESGFAFANSEDSIVYGYTMDLPTKTDQNNFGLLIDYLPETTESQFGYADITLIKDLKIPANASAGITSTYDYKGQKWQFHEIVFRTDNIGAVVILRQLNSAKQPINIVEWASVYLDSIRRPPTPCQITTVQLVPGAEVPTFEYHADGFYPREGRSVLLEGQVQVNGEVKKVLSAQLGQTGEASDGEGRISGTIAFLTPAQLAQQGVAGGTTLPEYTVTVIGHASDCKASMTVAWPGSPSTTPTP